ncbi:hypothetical protein D3C83_173230 [compost metagenome]
MPYKWKSAAEWLDEKIDNLRDGKFAEQDIAAIARALASKLDGDSIQDLFQDEMDEDGFFKEESDETDSMQ